MNSISVTASVSYTRLAVSTTSGNSRAQTLAGAGANPGTGNAGGPSANSGSAVILDLSVTAQMTLSQTTTAAASDPADSYYEQFFPTRDGFSSAALAAAVTDPGAESFSSGKTLDEVAASARASMDANYSAMAAGGKPFDYNSNEGDDWYSLMGNLDRRALYAVSSNQGGQFTQQEQGIAQSIMSQQQGLAMGLYSGPTRLAGNFADPYGGDNPARFAAAVHWLDGVSNDEKSSVAWAMSRASAQTAYDWTTDDSQPKQDLDSENPLVKLIRTAMETMKQGAARDHTNGNVNTADDLKKQPWFQGFDDQLDDAIAQTKALYGISA
ncbi:MAG TPA: hypothetical protein VGM59_01310 [Dongiaceae bacterium]|jgi:hypothetical protein